MAHNERLIRLFTVYSLVSGNNGRAAIKTITRTILRSLATELNLHLVPHVPERHVVHRRVRDFYLVVTAYTITFYFKNIR